MSRVVVDQVVTEYEMDPSGYVKGVRKIQLTNKDLDKSMNDSQKSFGSFLKNFVGLGAANPYQALANFAGNLLKIDLAVVGSLTSLTAALAAVGTAAYRQYAEFDSLIKALEAVEGSAEKANMALSDLRDLARQPGLGFEQSVRAFVQLRGVGESGDFAKTLIREIANVNARSGGNIESFGQAMLAISQIAMKPFLQGQEMLQLMNANIPVQGMLRNQFGTADPEELKSKGISSAQVLGGLVKEMEKLSRASGGAQNTIDNLSDSIHFAIVDAGSGLAGFGSVLDSLSSIIDQFTSKHIFGDAFKSITDSFFWLKTDSLSVADAVLKVTSVLVGLGTFLSYMYVVVSKIISELTAGLANLPISKSVKGAYSEFFGINAAERFYDSHKNILGAVVENAASSKDATQDGSATQIGGVQAVQVLEKIKENTDPLREITNQILGGGALAKNALNRQDISDLKSGRGFSRGHGGDPIEDAVRNLVGAIKASVVLSPSIPRRQS